MAEDETINLDELIAEVEAQLAAETDDEKFLRENLMF